MFKSYRLRRIAVALAFAAALAGGATTTSALADGPIIAVGAGNCPTTAWVYTGTTMLYPNYGYNQYELWGRDSLGGCTNLGIHQMYYYYSPSTATWVYWGQNNSFKGQPGYTWTPA